MRIALLVTLLLLLVPLAVAQPSQQTAVNGMDFEGQMRLESDTFFAEVSGVGEGTRALTLEAGFMKVVMENDSAEHYPEAQASSANADATTIYEGPGRLISDGVRDSHKVTLVVEDADVEVSTNQAELEPKPTTQVTRSGGYTQERSEEVFELGPQFRIRSLHGTVRVEGTFSFNLYEWDGIIEHAGGRDTFWTGERFTPLEPMQQVPEELGLPTHYGGRVDWQTAYVYVEDGVLEMEVREADASSASYSMGTAHGFASGRFEVMTPGTDGEGSVIRFGGAYDASFEAPRKSELYVSFAAPAPTASKGGDPGAPSVARSENVVDRSTPPASPAPTAITAPTLPDASLPSWTYLLALPALALAAAGVAFVRPIRRMRKLEDAYDLSIFGYIVDNGLPLLRSRRFGRQASVMYTVALLEERGPEAAEAHLREVRPRSRPNGATYEYLMARIRAAQTRFDEARRHVHSCLEAEPAFVVEIRHNRALEFLMRPPSDPGEGYA